MSAPAGKKRGLFSSIESREDALKVAKDASTAFFLIAGLQALLSFVIGFSILLDAAFYLLGGFFVRRFHSRAAAIVLLLLAGISAAVTVGNRMGADLGGGKNVVLALIVLWAAIRAVEATFKLRGRFAGVDEADQPARV
jgi:hypothetical protein